MDIQALKNEKIYLSLRYYLLCQKYYLKYHFFF